MWKIVKTDAQLNEETLITFEDFNDAITWIETTAKVFQWRFAKDKGQLFNGYFVDKDHNSYELR